MAPQYIPNTLAEKPMSVRTSLGPVDRDMANIEAEGGETVFILNKDGLPAHYNITGARHHSGGVPMNVPPDSFVFSDTASMRIKDPKLQEEFGMPVSKKGYTPAEIAKKYDINKYRKILQDPDSDKLQIATAEQVIANFQLKLGKLALVQEAMKGYPGGIPLIAMPYMAKYNLDPSLFLPTDLNEQQGGPAPGSMPVARQGGEPLRVYAPGGETGAEDITSLFPDPNSSDYRRIQRSERRARRQAERDYYNKFYEKVLLDLLQGAQQKQEIKPDYSTGIYLQMDPAGKPYYVDGRGVRINSFDNMYYGENNVPTDEEKNQKIIVRDGKRYRVTVTKKSNSSIDPNKVVPKDKATRPGDVYEENGKYYELQGYDITKPIGATKSGIFSGNIEEAKGKATIILDRLKEEGHAVFIPNQGWQIKASAKKALTTAEKEFLTDFFSSGKDEKLIGRDEPIYRVARQSLGTDGFYGYTDPDFYEYRFWQARNADKTAEDWDKLTSKEKIDNRATMFYALGYDVDNDSYLKQNINNPDKLYTESFISGEKKGRLRPGVSDYNELGFADAIENYFAPNDFRPSLGNDKKLGLEHADAFTFEIPTRELDKEVVEEKEELIDGLKKGQSPQYKTDQGYSPWWLQDLIKMSGAVNDVLSIRKYMPYKPQYSPYIPEPTFYDPTREIAATQETARIAADTTTGFGAGPQAVGARLAAIQGTAAEQIANTMGRYNNLNVGVANEFEYKKADIINDAQLKNVAFAKNYVDELNTVNQNYDNAKRAGLVALRESYINAVTNRAQAQALNALYENYMIYPSTGGYVRFTKGTPFTGEETATSDYSKGPEAFYDWWKNDHPDLDQSSAVAIWSAGTRNKTINKTPQENYWDAISGQYGDFGVPPMGYPAGQNQQQAVMKKGGVLPFHYNVGYNF